MRSASAAALGAQLVARARKLSCMRWYTEPLTSSGRSMRCTRTSIELDAQLLHGVAGAAEHVAGECGALGDDDFLQRAARHHALDAVLDVVAQALAKRLGLPLVVR